MAYPGETTGTMNGGTLGERLDEAAASTKDTFDEARAAATDTVKQAADYLRETGMGSMLADVETMVTRHPGPALVIACGLGFLLGRTLSR